MHAIYHIGSPERLTTPLLLCLASCIPLATVSSEGVQFAFLGVLWSASSTLDRAKKAVALGAEQALAAALVAHPKSERLQEAGLAALANLTATAEGQVKAAGCGAIELVVAGMAAFPLNFHLQEAGCSCLRNFAADPAAQAQVATEHAIRVRFRSSSGRLEGMISRRWNSPLWVPALFSSHVLWISQRGMNSQALMGADIPAPSLVCCGARDR